jgi:TolA-binding protein
MDAFDRGLPNWGELEDDAEEVNEELANVADLETQLEELQNTLDIMISNNDPDTATVRQQRDNLQKTIAQKNSQITLRKRDIEKRAMLIIDFVKYHFQDNSVYVDEKPHQMVEGNNVYTVVNYETASLDNLTKRFSKVTVETKDSPYSAHHTISVKGDNDKAIDNANEYLRSDNLCYVINNGKEGQDYNIMTRDIEFLSKASPTTIETSSFAVVHQIDSYLVNDRIFKNGRFTTENE